MTLLEERPATRVAGVRVVRPVVPALPADPGLEAVAAARVACGVADVAMVREIAGWAVGSTARSEAEAESGGRSRVPSVAGAERLVRPGGAGSPLVGEFCAADLGARLGLAPWDATRLLADALTLVHRLPLTLALVEEGVVDLWRVRRAAARVRDLPSHVSEAVDLALSTPTRPGGDPPVGSWSKRRLGELVDQTVLLDDPTRTDARVGESRTDRFVRLRHDLYGTTEVLAHLDTLDALHLSEHLDTLARTLETAGKMPEGATSREGRRAAALGHLARHGAQTPDGGADGATPVAPTRPAATLHVHLDPGTDTVPASWAVEGAGPIAARAARDALADAQVTAVPVIDLNTELTATSYTAPRRLRDQLAHRQHSTCTFPHGTRDVGPTARAAPAERGPATASRPTPAGGSSNPPPAFTSGPAPPATPT